MFLNFEEKIPRKHATYSNKPIPILQQEAISISYQTDAADVSSIIKRADHDMLYGRIPSATINDLSPDPVPITSDVKYDPSHPDADWYGTKFNTH